MKKEVVEYVARCFTFQQVKAEHQRPVGPLQLLLVSKWKWDHITMDFVSSLPRTGKGHNSVWVIVDRLTKEAHFLAVKTTDTLITLIRLYIKEIVRLHDVPLTIVSDRDLRFVSQFWKSLHQALGTLLKFSMTFHPQTDKKSERVIQILKDMLRACTLDFKGS